MKTFYKIENNKVVGFQMGTDKEGDATSTAKHMEAWAGEAEDREIVVQDYPPKGNYFVFEKGGVRPATDEEILEIEKEKRDQEDAAQEQVKDLKDSIRLKLTAKDYTPLTEEEAKMLLGLTVEVQPAPKVAPKKQPKKSRRKNR